MVLGHRTGQPQGLPYALQQLLAVVGLLEGLVPLLVVNRVRHRQVGAQALQDRTSGVFDMGGDFELVGKRDVDAELPAPGHGSRALVRPP